MNKQNLCPVCGYNLGFEAWDVDNSPSDEICSSCGTQFGYDDCDFDFAAWNESNTQDDGIFTSRWTEVGCDDRSFDIEKRNKIHGFLRKKWIDNGMNWWGEEKIKPIDWDPFIQLKKIGVTIR